MKAEDIKNIIDFAIVNKFEVTMKDISYVILENTYSDAEIAYLSIFGKDCGKTKEDIKEYDTSDEIECVRGYMFSNRLILSRKEEENRIGLRNMSAEENQDGMIRLIDEIYQAIEDKKMSKKDGLGRISDIRTKLQGRFNIEQSNDQLHIVVNNKYNAVCPYCNHEISIKKD